jgi:hypothetical protein
MRVCELAGGKYTMEICVRFAHLFLTKILNGLTQMVNLKVNKKWF